MRRSFVRHLAVWLFVLSIIVPASAAPRRDDGPVAPTRLIERIVEVVKHVVSTLDDFKSSVPLP